jgi:ribonuclease HII|tara:strand:+ start:1786 stop:2331 length:546 start_codon:yes stop_codon:yes gene_type:complete
LKLVAGVDEVGRGCLAGPVIAAAVILRKNIPGLKDSKKLSKKKREELSLIIMQNSYFSFGSSSPKEIDKINILQASLLAMKRAILNLSVEPGKILIDGIHKPDLNTDTQTIISGDSYIDEISAASIIAKVYRDNLMMQFDKEYPNFYFSSHMGYGTKMHKAAIKKYGITPIHRKTFKGVIS